MRGGRGCLRCEVASRVTTLLGFIARQKVQVAEGAAAGKVAHEACAHAIIDGPPRISFPLGHARHRDKDEQNVRDEYHKDDDCDDSLHKGRGRRGEVG